ncbi:MAG: YceD family protein [bacterium]
MLGTLNDISATFHETCDSCDAPFVRSVTIPSYVARFVFEDELAKKESPDSEEVLFFINKKSETIDIEDMVVQSLLLNDPFVKRCDACTKRLENMSDDDDEFNDVEPKSNIIFR